MRKFLCILSTLIFLSSCAVISEKAAQKAEKENSYLAVFLNKPVDELNKAFGKPTQTLTENNQTVQVYEVKRVVFDCQRKFTVDNKNIVTGFISTCWD